MKKALSLFLAGCLVAFMFVAVSAIVYSANSNTVVYAATDDSEYDLNWDEVDLTENTYTVTDEPVEPEAPSLTTPIIALSIAGVACVGLGAAYAVITVRRKKK